LRKKEASAYADANGIDQIQNSKHLPK
jgi:hypothetical protein